MTLIGRMTDLADRLTRIPVKMAVPQYKEVSVLRYVGDTTETITLKPFLKVESVSSNQATSFVGNDSMGNITLIADYRLVTVSRNIPVSTWLSENLVAIMIDGVPYQPVGIKEDALTHYSMLIKRHYD